MCVYVYTRTYCQERVEMALVTLLVLSHSDASHSRTNSQKSSVTWTYSSTIIMSHLQTTYSEPDTVLGNYTKSLNSAKTFDQVLSIISLKKKKTEVLRDLVNLPKAYSWQVTELEFDSRLLILEHTHLMSKVYCVPQLFLTKMYSSPIHWCFITTWLCQITLWENAMCTEN